MPPFGRRAPEPANHNDRDADFTPSSQALPAEAVQRAIDAARQSLGAQEQDGLLLVQACAARALELKWNPERLARAMASLRSFA